MSGLTKKELKAQIVELEKKLKTVTEHKEMYSSSSSEKEKTIEGIHLALDGIGSICPRYIESPSRYGGGTDMKEVSIEGRIIAMLSRLSGLNPVSRTIESTLTEGNV